MAGTSCSAWRRPPANEISPSTVPSAPIPVATREVAVSIASMNTSDRLLAACLIAVDEGGEGVAAHRPRSTGGVEGHHALVVAVTEPQRHVEPFDGQQRADAVTPFHDGHPRAAQELVETEIVQVLEAIESVDVHVYEGQPCLVFAHERERRTDDFVEHAE